VEKTERPMDAAASGRLPRWPTKMVVTELTAYMLRVAMAMGVPMPQRRLDSSHTIRAASAPVVTAGASPSTDPIAAPSLARSSQQQRGLSSTKHFLCFRASALSDLSSRELRGVKGERPSG
jgi:hypothetical protein